MRIKQLKKLIEGLSDDTVILVPTPDHSYRPASAEVGPVRRNTYGWCEDDGGPESGNELGLLLQAIIIT
jgi:hypothetical protein